MIHLIWGPIAILFIVTAGLFKNIAPRLPACIFHEITGLPCPTCGATRSVMALSRFDLMSSLTLNPLVTLFAIGLIIFSLLFLIGAITGKSLNIALAEKGKKVIRYSAFVLIALNWLFLILIKR